MKDTGCSAPVLTKTGIWICVGSASVCWESLIVLKYWDRDIKENEGNAFITIPLA